jgi:hypothetical protein
MKPGKAPTKAAELLNLIRIHGPVSPNRLVDITGDHRQSLDRYIRECHEANLIHVAAYGPSPTTEGRTVKLWAIGPGEDAKRPRVKQKRYVYPTKGTPKSRQASKARTDRERRIIEEANRLPTRDPITAAWFGKADRCYTTAILHRHIYSQSMAVTDDELEPA